MRNIAVIEVPAYGHVNPSLPLVRELVRRGERVTYYDDEEFSRRVVGVGATFRAYPPGALTSRDIALATQTRDLTRVPAVILEATERLVSFLLDELRAERPDVVVLDSNALWGHIATQLLAVPRVSLMTTFVLDTRQFMRLSVREWLHALRPVLPNMPRLLKARTRVLRRFGRVVPRPAFPARGDLNIAFLPRELQPSGVPLDDTFRFVGPMIDPEAQRGDAPEVALSPDPVVYISLGTLHRGSTDFFRECFAAFADLPLQVVLSVGNQTDVQSLGSIPGNFIVRPFVAQLDVLQHAAVFITHGGMNSALEGLSCGVPLVVIPQHFEQLMIGLEAERRGAGIVLRNHVSGRRITAPELRQAMDRVLANASFHRSAQAMQATLRECGGYRQAADEIQAFLARRTASLASVG